MAVSILISLTFQSHMAIAGRRLGHTVNNGGGTGELNFTRAWKNLAGTFAPCLSPSNLCRLTTEEYRTLNEVMRKFSSCFDKFEFDTALTGPAVRLGTCGETVKVQPAALYAADGQAVDGVKLHELILGALIGSCNLDLDFSVAKDIAQAALKIKYFRSHTVGSKTLHLASIQGSNGSELWLDDGAGLEELTPIIRRELEIANSTPLQLENLHSQSTNRGLILVGMLARGTAARSSFELSLESGVWRLLVY
jgi:hypothetical protein